MAKAVYKLHRVTGGRLKSGAHPVGAVLSKHPSLRKAVRALSKYEAAHPGKKPVALIIEPDGTQVW